MTPVERLRAAETALRTAASAATAMTWVTHGGSVYAEEQAEGSKWVIGDATHTEDADYIALMSPPVALAMADWLADAAENLDLYGIEDAKYVKRHATALCDALLGPEPSP